MRLVILLALAVTVVSAQEQPSAQDVFQKNCVKCHAGPKAPNRLELTDYAGVMRGGKSGRAIVNGDAKTSLLYLAIVGVASHVPQMPPWAPLTWKEIFAIRRFIDGGATKDLFVERFIMVDMSGRAVP